MQASPPDVGDQRLEPLTPSPVVLSQQQYIRYDGLRHVSLLSQSNRNPLLQPGPVLGAGGREPGAEHAAAQRAAAGARGGLPRAPDPAHQDAGTREQGPEIITEDISRYRMLTLKLNLNIHS